MVTVTEGRVISCASRTEVFVAGLAVHASVKRGAGGWVWVKPCAWAREFRGGHLCQAYDY